MRISGGGVRFAQPPTVGKRSTAGGTDSRFSSQVNASRTVNPQQVATACYEMLRNALKRFGMLWQE
jgi:hypothetical protein